MGLDLSRLWVTTWHRRGAVRERPMVEYLRTCCLVMLQGGEVEEIPVGVFESLEDAVSFGREVKKRRRTDERKV